MRPGVHDECRGGLLPQIPLHALEVLGPTIYQGNIGVSADVDHDGESPPAPLVCHPQVHPFGQRQIVVVGQAHHGRVHLPHERVADEHHHHIGHELAERGPIEVGVVPAGDGASARRLPSMAGGVADRSLRPFSPTEVLSPAQRLAIGRIEGRWLRRRFTICHAHCYRHQEKADKDAGSHPHPAAAFGVGFSPTVDLKQLEAFLRSANPADLSQISRLPSAR
mmetsp:Transcript_33456/g.80000  ORF Transcript_33456/g.80000 Transcript_33456/m.80000 type:complete len:222 (-) Transcript_33456:47-712(-)